MTPTPFFQSDNATLHGGDCLAVMPLLDEAMADSIVCDPPYGLSFMGKDWDHGVPGEHFWREALRVAKPGAHLLAFGGTRTFHRLMVAIEDAGWEIRDTLMWVYGSGFPKSLDVSKAIDKAAGAEREVVGSRKLTGTARIKEQAGFGATSGRSEDAYQDGSEINDTLLLTAPATEAARQWSGWGTALKPAWEPIILARKPLAGTVAANVLQHGTGGLNIDGCRIDAGADYTELQVTQGAEDRIYGDGRGLRTEPTKFQPSSGRWPANLIHDGSDEVTAQFPSEAGGSGRASGPSLDEPYGRGVAFGARNGTGTPAPFYGDQGSAARFFYCAKASKADRDEGLEGFELGPPPESGRSKPAEGRQSALGNPRANHHPTVKPCELMRYLCRLVTPPGGLVLDPFMGSGSTGKAAILEGFRFVGIELTTEYLPIAAARCRWATKQAFDAAPLFASEATA